MRFFMPFSVLAVLGAAGCANEAQSDCAGDGVVVSDAWTRATTPAQKMSAAYVQLCNGADVADKLVSVTFDGADAAELHTTRMNEAGVASMAPLTDGLPLPSGEAVSMAPGGAHIMLIGLSNAFEDGDDPSLTLNFENAPPQTIIFEVRADAGEDHNAH
ncbi:copper chaperone PCu(A)C [Hyphococcus sp.]|uniref:copper chaperone PCu(A)C n=1 Tax=Hyphococcus sp. TaxID=2038636 RepID=UPI003CCB8A4F